MKKRTQAVNHCCILYHKGLLEEKGGGVGGSKGVTNAATTPCDL